MVRCSGQYIYTGMDMRKKRGVEKWEYAARLA